MASFPSPLRALALTTALLALLALLPLGAAPALAATFVVTKTADTNDGSCDADCSLREAIRAANAAPGADTITLPAGTYQITLAGADDVAALGDFDITDSVSISGAGAATTIVDGRDLDRVFDVAPVTSCGCTVAFAGLTVTNGSANAANFNAGGAIFIGFGTTASIAESVISSSAATTSGGGVEARGASLALANVSFQNNRAAAAGGALRAIGDLAITGGGFTANEAEFGGAIALAQGSGNTISISGARFDGNRAVATPGGADDDGGAIHADLDTPMTLSGNSFTGNSAAGSGGAIFFRDNATEAAVGSLSASFNRIAGNTAAAGSGLFVASGLAVGENSWWGCNAGPGAAPCDRVVGPADVEPWLVLSIAASPSTVARGGASTVTAGFFVNSDGAPVMRGNLAGLAGAPVSFAATLGTLGNAQPSIQANGAASADYTAGSTAGAGSASATVDAQTVTTSITVDSLSRLYLPLLRR